jgi:hypothetical protein
MDLRIEPTAWMRFAAKGLFRDLRIGDNDRRGSRKAGAVSRGTRGAAWGRRMMN